MVCEDKVKNKLLVLAVNRHDYYEAGTKVELAVSCINEEDAKKVANIDDEDIVLYLPINEENTQSMRNVVKLMEKELI
jgi:hypothetical protein